MSETTLSVLSVERKQRLEKELTRFVQLLTEHNDPERIIVFISHLHECRRKALN